MCRITRINRLQDKLLDKFLLGGKKQEKNLHKKVVPIYVSHAAHIYLDECSHL